MADSTLDPRRPKPPETSKGYGTEALGPSGSSDSGSDLQGPGLAGDVGLGLDSGTTSDLDRSRGAGHDIGDANLDSDSSETGSGERSTAGRDDDVGEAHDIAPDRLVGSELPLPPDALDRVVVDEDAPGEGSEEERALANRRR